MGLLNGVQRENGALECATSSPVGDISITDELVNSWNPSFKVLYPGIDRPPLLSEYLPEHPYMVLLEVFSRRGGCWPIKDQLELWLHDVDIDENGGEVSVERQALELFYDEMKLLIDALGTLNRQTGKVRELNAKDNNPGNPWLIVRHFCKSYTLVFTKRELWCLLHVAIDHAVDNPNILSPSEVLSWYEEVVALVESAYLLFEKGRNCSTPPAPAG